MIDLHSMNTRILIIEDYEPDAEMAEREIAKSVSNCIFKRVNSKDEFILALEFFEPDLLLVEYTLPTINWLDILSLTREKRPLTPVIIWTAAISEEIVVECMKAGAVNCVRKNNSIRLVTSVVQALDDSKTLKEKKEQHLELLNTNQQLEKNNIFISSVLDSLSQHIVVIDLKGNIISVNVAWKKFGKENGLDLNKFNFIGINYFDVCKNAPNYANGEEAVLANEGIRSVLDGTHSDYYLEYPCHSPTEKRWFQMHVSPMLGEIKGAVISHINITEQKLAEESRKIEERDKEALINNTKDLMWSIDADFSLRAANQSYIENIKLFTGKIVKRGQSVLDPDLFSPELISFWKDLYLQVLNGESIAREFQTVATDSHPGSWLGLWLNPIWSQNKVIGVACFGKDVTENKMQKQALINLNEELKSSKDKLQSSFNELAYQRFAIDQHSIVAFTDVEGTILYVNDKFCNISQYSKEELIGNNHRIINSGYHSKEFFKNMYHTIKGGKVWNGEIQNRAKDGSFYWVDTTIVPFIDEKTGVIFHFVAIRTDITALKIQEAEKEHLIRELTLNNNDLLQFSYIVSHNLRAPVSNLIGLLNLLDDVKIENEFLQEIMIGFKISVGTLSNTLEDLHKIIEIKKQPSIQKEEIDLWEIIQSVLLQIDNLVKLHRPKIKINLKKFSKIFFNKAYSESIFLNLFTNAIRFQSSERNLEIQIYTQKLENSILLVFEDNGIGIDIERYKDRLFGLYQKFHNHVESKGFGLYLIKSQIESVGGEIDVESKINFGTKFLIKFPII